MKEVKKRLNAKLECYLTRPHTLSHEIFERDILQQLLFYNIRQKKNYSFLELNNYNGYMCAIYNCCFTTYLQPSQGKINFSP